MSQRTRRSLAEAGTPSTPTRVTRNSAVTSETVSTTPQRLTRKSLAQAEAVAETKTPTRRTRTSSVSSVLSDVSEIGSESGRVTRRSTRLSGIKLEEPAELPVGRKRTSSVSSVTSETPSQAKPTTRKSTAASNSTPVKNDTPAVAKNKILDGTKHEDSPYRTTSTRKSRKLSLTTVEENESDTTDKKSPAKLSTHQFEEITFSSDDEGPAKSAPVDRRRKSILPKSDLLKTITEDETDDIEVVTEELSKSPKKGVEESKSPKNPKKDLLQKHINAESQKLGSPRVNVNRIDATDVSPNLKLDRVDTLNKSPIRSISNEKKRNCEGNKVALSQERNSPAHQKGKKSIEKTVEVVESPKRKSFTSNESQNTEIHFEEIVLDEDDDDVVMEEDLVIETGTTNEVLNQSTEKGSKKRKSLNESATESAKKRKSMETKENEKPKDSDLQIGESVTEANAPAVKETLQEMITRLKLEKAKVILIKKQKKLRRMKRHSEKEKERIKKRRLHRAKLAKGNLTPKLKKEVPVVQETPKDGAHENLTEAAKKANNKEKDSEAEQKRLERILQKKAAKKAKWFKRLSEKKAESLAHKKEEKAAAKAIRVNIYKEQVSAKAKKIASQKAKKAERNERRRARKREQLALANQSEEKVKVEKKESSEKCNITLEDIVSKLDAMTKPKPVLAEKKDIDNKLDETTRGKAKSGRFWKETKDK